MKTTLSTIKKLLAFTLLTATNVQACNKDCDQKPPPFDCTKAMHTYAKTIEHYAEAVDQVDLTALNNFSHWLTENSRIHITCDAYNQNKLLEPNYKVLFLETMNLNNSIKLLIEWNGSSIKDDEYFAKKLKESYQLINNSTKVFIH